MKKLLLLPLLMIIFFCFAQDGREVIGKPFKIGNLLVSQFCFPLEMDWDTAIEACKSLGEGWRLPTKKELSILCSLNKDIRQSQAMDYWSCTELSVQRAWVYYFPGCDSYHSNKGKEYVVRAVKSL
jgi:hypothetical protein